MTTIAIDLPRNYANEETTIGSWLFTKDHKRIALLFFVSITFFSLLAVLPRQ
jgi:cytochrome c oxidase subunit I